MMPLVKALQWHTCNGQTYDVGDVYEAPDELIATLAHQRKAILTSEAPAPETPAPTAVELEAAVKPAKAKKG